MAESSLKIAGVAGVVALVGLGGFAAYQLASGSGGDETEAAVAPPSRFAFSIPIQPWSKATPRRIGTIAGGGRVEAGGATVVPTFGEQTAKWSHDDVGAGQVLAAEVAGAVPGEVEWRFLHANPHTSFAARWSSTMEEVTKAPPTTTFSLPAGDLLYPNAAYELVPLTDGDAVVPRLGGGPITWRNGADVVTFSQWSADRVVLRTADDGTNEVEFQWWSGENRRIPEECMAVLGKRPVELDARVLVSFQSAAPLFVGRLPSGGTGGAVPVFFDPASLTDRRFADGAATSADDFAARARTVALGHSNPSEPRHGNGGLGGTGVGGTVLIPAEHAGENEALEALDAALQETTVELVDEVAIMPANCEAWAKALDEQSAILVEPVEFDGSFPNLLEATGADAAPAPHGETIVWPSVQLTGRRKEVVQQTLSRTYLDRLERRRGIAIVRIPLLATRNPLVPAAAESLLEPERQGSWTIEENFSKALAEIELLAEEENFELLGLQSLTDHLLGAYAVTLVPNADGSFTVRNPGESVIGGLTLIADGATVPVAAPETTLRHEVRDSPGGRKQTWVWFDLPATAEVNLRLERPEQPVVEPIDWQVPAPF